MHACIYMFIYDVCCYKCVPMQMMTYGWYLVSFWILLHLIYWGRVSCWSQRFLSLSLTSRNSLFLPPVFPGIQEGCHTHPAFIGLLNLQLLQEHTCTPQHIYTYTYSRGQRVTCWNRFSLFLGISGSALPSIIFWQPAVSCPKSRCAEEIWSPTAISMT